MSVFDDHKEVDRCGFLHCMAWVGTTAVWTLSGGVLKGMPIEPGAWRKYLGVQKGHARHPQHARFVWPS